jgi:F-type H+-transporting ATPase subunit delta
MAEFTTTARPYARAVFELAQVSNQFDNWSGMLSFMAAIAHDPQMHALLDSPRLTSQQAAKMFNSVCADNIDESGQNFVKLLAENRRLVLLPEIAALYELYRSEAEGKIEAEVVSAQEITKQQLSAIMEALKTRLGRDVQLQSRTDPMLLGGAIIRAGDLVIDGSIRGKLNKLSSVLSR